MGRVIPFGVVVLVLLVGCLAVVIARIMTRSYRETIRQQDKTIAGLRDENAELRKDEGEQVTELRRQRDLYSGLLDTVERMLVSGTVPGFDNRTLAQYVVDNIREGRPRNRRA